jgi:U8 snoRNA-decapping enzyme
MNYNIVKSFRQPGRKMEKHNDQGDRTPANGAKGGKKASVNNSNKTNQNEPKKEIGEFGKEIPFESCLLEKDHAHAVHCMIWAKWEDHFVIEEFVPHAAILMQVRFDGCIGFPGGMVDEDITGISSHQAKEKVISAVTRELAEEMNVDFTRHVITKDDYMCTYRHPSKKLFLHFFTFEMSLDSLREIENMALKSMDYGNEVMGILRVPLYTMNDGYRGFPAFLNQNFIQCSRQQLIQGLEVKKILTKNEIDEAVSSSRVNRTNFV